MITADIISIGDELLIGQVVNTNAAWMAAFLNRYGINARQMHTISDSKEEIVSAVSTSLKNSDIVLATGGLGPTKDDITKHVLADYFGCKGWFTHQPSLENLQVMLAKGGVAIGEQNRKQADLPDGCIPILNRLGTAPGMWFEQSGKVLVAMPGVPYEMKGIMEDIMPMLQQHFSLDSIVHKTMLTYGIPESMLAERIANWEDQLPKYLKLAYLPSPETGVRLRLSAYGGNHEQLEKEIEDLFRKLEPILGSSIYGWGEESLESAIGKLLKDRNQSVSTAESCTGGKIASLITRIAGSSAYYKGSIVAYDNSVKQQMLGVKEERLAKYGAVSQQVVEEMAKGVKEALQTDYAIATSGIAGPDGGTAEKPVGTVWIAIATPTKIICRKQQLTNGREHIITRSSATALNMLRLAILEEL
ncbi:MAG: competence/damage-inducible protein A [Prevotellaceae bacterium]|jgi:nicotinamide-nucleotide amidase|nr:competence/damage-inducible protein A [Prevotellaceae bacterium]